MLKVLCIFWGIIFTTATWGAPLSIETQCGSAILLNLDTGNILFEKNAHEPSFPASTTKVATVLYALKKKGDQLDQIVKVQSQSLASITPQAKKQSNYRNPAYWLETDGDVVGLKAGEEISLRHLLCAAMICSANDASNVIAQHLGGTIPKFMDHLNCYLKEIGCKNTHFLNPHGFHHPEHVTTAYEMALIAREAMSIPVFREIVSTTRMVCPPTNLEGERIFIQSNLLLRKGSYHYDKACGVKTGTTRAAGKTLVAAARDENRSLLLVLMKNQENTIRYRDAIKIFEAAFQEPKHRCTLLKPGIQDLQIPVQGAKNPLKACLKNAVSYEYFPSETPTVKAKIRWSLASLPIEKDEIVGTVIVTDERGKILNEQSLYAAEKVEATAWVTLKQNIVKQGWGKKSLYMGGILIFFLYMIFFRTKTRKRSY